LLVVVVVVLVVIVVIGLHLKLYLKLSITYFMFIGFLTPFMIIRQSMMTEIAQTWTIAQHNNYDTDNE